MHVCLWWVFLPFKLLSLRFLPYSPDFRFNPRQYVNNTDTFIGCQDLFFFFLPFILAGLLPCPLLRPSCFSPSVLPPLPWLLPDRPSANVHQMPPPLQDNRRRCRPIPQPVNAHSSVRYRQMELLSALASLCLSLCLPHSLLSILSSSFLSRTK